MRRALRIIPTAIALAFIVLVSFSATAVAAGAVAPQDADLTDLFKPVYDAFSGGHYAYGAAALTIVVVAAVKRYLGDKVAWLHTDAGGSTLALVGAVAVAMASGLAAPNAVVTWALVKSSLLVGVGAAGGYATVKNLLIDPLVKPLQDKLPVWAQPVFGLVLWIFEKPLAGQDIVTDAQKAGDVAVQANPGQGSSAVVGQPTDVK